VPAAAVIPAPIVCIKVVAVKKLVVGPVWPSGRGPRSLRPRECLRPGRMFRGSAAALD
jgi:hypothetical protein